MRRNLLEGRYIMYLYTGRGGGGQCVASSVPPLPPPPCSNTRSPPLHLWVHPGTVGPTHTTLYTLGPVTPMWDALIVRPIKRVYVKNVNKLSIKKTQAEQAVRRRAQSGDLEKSTLGSQS